MGEFIWVQMLEEARSGCWLAPWSWSYSGHELLKPRRVITVLCGSSAHSPWLNVLSSSYLFLMCFCFCYIQVSGFVTFAMYILILLCPLSPVTFHSSPLFPTNIPFLPSWYTFYYPLTVIFFLCAFRHMFIRISWNRKDKYHISLICGI